MEYLPNELRQKILKHLQLQDLKSIRLASNLWAELGQPYLIPYTFLSLPHRDDFSRLSLLSQHAPFARNIEKLELVMGEFNDYHARHNIYYVEYMKDPEDRDSDIREAWIEYMELKKLKDSKADDSCRLELLDQTFKNLPNLRAIDIDLMRCPSRHPLLQQIWQIPTTRLLNRVLTTQNFAKIIHAARHLSLDSLTHDCLPFEVWSQRRIHDNVPITFHGLRSLKLSFDYSVFPNALNCSNSFSDFRSALCAAPNLEIFHMGFANFARPEFEFASCMGEFTWHNLHTLGLEDINIAEDDIASFLTRHAASLKRLQLGVYKKLELSSKDTNMYNVVHLRHGTLRGLLTYIRDQMRLEKLNMKGNIEEASNFLTAYEYHKGLYDDEWLRVPHMIETAAHALIAEQFVLGDVEWDDSMIGLTPNRVQ